MNFNAKHKGTFFAVIVLVNERVHPWIKSIIYEMFGCSKLSLNWNVTFLDYYISIIIDGSSRIQKFSISCQDNCNERPDSININSQQSPQIYNYETNAKHSYWGSTYLHLMTSGEILDKHLDTFLWSNHYPKQLQNCGRKASAEMEHKVRERILLQEPSLPIPNWGTQETLSFTLSRTHLPLLSFLKIPSSPFHSTQPCKIH